MKLTKHFHIEELACKCCGQMGFAPDFLQALESLRVAYGKPMIVSSGYRCPKHNGDVSTTGGSGPHTIGAVDVLVRGADALHLIDVALGAGWTGFGISQKGASRFIHLDRLNDVGHPRPIIWSY